MAADDFFGSCHAPRCFIRQFDGKYPVKGIAISSWATLDFYISDLLPAVCSTAVQLLPFTLYLSPVLLSTQHGI